MRVPYGPYVQHKEWSGVYSAIKLPRRNVSSLLFTDPGGVSFGFAVVLYLNWLLIALFSLSLVAGCWSERPKGRIYSRERTTRERCTNVQLPPRPTTANRSLQMAGDVSNTVSLNTVLEC